MDMKVNGTLKVQSLNEVIPIIYMDWETLMKARHFVRTVPTECQWFHTVRKEVHENSIIYVLDHLYIPEQTVTGGTVDSDPTMIMKLSAEVRSDVGDDRDAYNDIISHLTCWVHSHVKMASQPSGTDNENFRELISMNESNGNPVIMMIFNKRDEVFTRIYDPDLQMIFENVQMIIEDEPIDYSYVDESAEHKLTERKIVTTNNTHRNDHAWNGARISGGATGGSQAIRNAQSTAAAAAAASKKTTHQAGTQGKAQASKSTGQAQTVKPTHSENTTTAQVSSEKTPTDVKSYDDTDFEWSDQWAAYGSQLATTFLSSREDDLANLVTIASTNSSATTREDAIDRIVKMLHHFMQEKDIAIATKLLFGTEQECENECHVWDMLPNDDDYFSGAWTEFREELSDGIIDPATNMSMACRLAKGISSATDEKGIQQWVKHWWNLIYSDVDIMADSENTEADPAIIEAEYKSYSKSSGTKTETPSSESEENSTEQTSTIPKPVDATESDNKPEDSNG